MGGEGQADILIVGQGLAGTLLAQALIERGARVRVADPGHHEAASEVAAGLINPVTGQRLVKAGALETLLPAALGRMAAIEAATGEVVHHRQAILRHLDGERSRAAWQRRRTDPAFIPYLVPGPTADAIWIHGGAVVDTLGLLTAMRRWLQARDALIPAPVDSAAVAETANGVAWAGHAFGRVVFCDGAALRRNPWFPGAPLRPVKGQVLEGRAPGLPDHPVHRGRTLVPLGEDRFRLGATYDHDAVDNQPTAAGRQALEASLADLLPDARARITHHLAGIRPGTPDGLPLLGWHCQHPRVVLFNGLGSKGLLLGPYYAERLAATLLDGDPVPAEAAWDRFGAGP
jgi:glycine/D-amino acid oxidase-like deaminating enzyme